MTTIQNSYGTSNQTITITLASLTNTSMQQSTAIDNSSNKFSDVLIGGKIKTGASGTSSSGYVMVYAYATADGGTTYSGNASGSDGSFSGRKNNLKLVGAFDAVANSTTYQFWFSLAAALGTVPDRWGLVFENQTGGTLSATGGDHAVFYQGVRVENV